jgi:hypothetical protein
MKRATEQEIRHRLSHGNKWPYDASDAWWQSSGEPDGAPADNLDWATRAARAVLADMCDRRGIKRGFEDIPEDVRREIVETTAAIIRMAHAEHQ